MAVIRVSKTSNYTVMSNTHLKEVMSLKAKGLLSVMLSLPDNWDYSVEGLCGLCTEKETAVKSTLNELRKFGYLVVNKKMPNETKSGRIEYEYIVYEQPIGKQTVEKQDIENLPIEILPLENQGQLKTNIISTKISSTKKTSVFTPPTFEEVQEYATSRGHSLLAKKFYDYFSVSNWVDSKGNKVRNWKQKFITWEQNDKTTKQTDTTSDYYADILKATTV